MRYIHNIEFHVLLRHQLNSEEYIVFDDEIEGEIKEVKQRLITNSGVIYERKIWGTTRMFLETVPEHALKWYAVRLQRFNNDTENKDTILEAIEVLTKQIMSNKLSTEEKLIVLGKMEGMGWCLKDEE